MEVIDHWKIPHNRKDEFKIYPIGDIHAGSVHCNEELIKHTVDIIDKEPNAYWVGMGDYADSITKNDKRFDMQGLAGWVIKDDIVDSQRKYLKNLLYPIRNKCLVMLTGNHEETIRLDHQDNITKHLCEDLEVPYGGYQCYLVLRFERTNTNNSVSDHKMVVIHCWHGDGAAQTEGARLMRLMRLVNDIEADIYLMGHLHACTTHSPSRLAYKRGRIKSHDIIATLTGSWLTTYTQSSESKPITISYGERKGYKPSRLGCPVIHIKPDKDTMTLESPTMMT